MGVHEPTERSKPTLVDAFAVGWDARQVFGFDRRDNPYRPDTRDFYAWDHGWAEADGDA